MHFLVPAKSYTIGDSLFRIGPWKDLWACNWVPRPIGWRGSPDFAGSGGAFGWGGGGARPRAHY
jgi:hypothetical protein